MNYKAVLFDLDGTLLDTLDDLADSMNAALARLGAPQHPTPAYRHFVGDGVIELCRRVLPADRRDVVAKSVLGLNRFAEGRRRASEATSARRG